MPVIMYRPAQNDRELPRYKQNKTGYEERVISDASAKWEIWPGSSVHVCEYGSEQISLVVCSGAQNRFSLGINGRSVYTSPTRTKTGSESVM